MRTFLKRALGLGALAGLAYAAWAAWQRRAPHTEREIQWASAPFPFPPEPRPATRAASVPTPTDTQPPITEPAPGTNASSTNAPDTNAPGTNASVEPGTGGACPASHPVKAKLSSGIYHVPGGANYERTKADRCYADEAAAEQDGLRRSKV